VSRGTSFRRVLRLVLLAAVLLLAGRLYWVKETRSPTRPVNAPPGTLIIPPGSSADAIGRLLQSQGLVRHPLAFRVLVLLKGVSGSLKAGEYALEGPLTLDQIVDLLA